MTAASQPPPNGPLSILKDEREVQSFPGRMAWLFEPYLQDLYERRQWQEIDRVENVSTGSRLVAALVLATARTGELVSASESAELDKFHADRRRWLISYLLGRTCDPDCRGKLVDVMLSSYGEAGGDYDEPLRRLLRQPHAEAAPAFGHLHARLLWCQVDADDLAEFRDRVLVPAVMQALAQPDAGKPPEKTGDKAAKPADKAADKTATLDDLVALTALVPDPTEPKALAAWKSLMAALATPAPGSAGKAGSGGDRYQRAFVARRASAARERQNPPPMIKKISFCNAAEASASTPNLDQ